MDELEKLWDEAGLRSIECKQFRATRTFTNFKVGQVIDIIISGDYTLTMSATASGTPSIKKIGSTSYSGSSDNVIQVVCTNASSSTPQFLFSVNTFADATNP